MTLDTTCPSEEHLFGYMIDQKEEGVDNEYIKSHIDSCEICSKAFAKMANWDSDMDNFITALDQDETPEALPEKLGKYKIIDQLGQGGMGIVLKAFDPGLDRTVAIKVIKGSFSQVPDFKERFMNEAKHLARINSENIVQIYNFDSEGDVTYLVMEYVEGKPFHEWCKQHAHNLPVFFDVFRQILLGLREAHNSRILHRDLTPNNIMIRNDGKVKILDFGLAKALGEHVYQGEFVFSGTMTYVAPEVLSGDAPSMTSDMYSVALACYEGLTGHHPFRCDTTSETKLKILSAELVPLTMYRPDIPKAFEEILLKCLDRSRLDRFQHVDEIEVALAEVMGLESKISSRVAIGEEKSIEIHDMKLNSPMRIYGREKLMEDLKSKYASIAEGKVWSSIFFGSSGIGKSQLINSFMDSVKCESCSCISGKFEQMADPKPYSAIITAFERMIRELRLGRSEVLNAWKERFREKMHAYGRLLSDVIPSLNELFTDLPAVKKMPPYEARQRFENAMIDFIRTFCRADQNLILFIDDIQWADSGSLNLITRLMRGANLSNLLLLLSFRGDDIVQSSWLKEQFDYQKDQAVPYQIIEMDVLGKDIVLDYLHDVMIKYDGDLHELAEVILSKTGGNPLYFRQWIEQLHRLNFIYPDTLHGCWLWKIEKIKALDPHEDLLQLMREKLDLLNSDMRMGLSLAACIGAKFKVQVLAELMGVQLSYLNEKLKHALELGLVEIESQSEEASQSLQADKVYRFYHDQVQNAAYKNFSERERSHAHRRIARLRLKKIKAIDLDAWLFDITHHYNLVTHDSLSEYDLFERVKLNYRAGRRARRLHSYKQANRFLKAAAMDLPENIWEDRYQMAFMIHMERMVCAFLDADFEIANEQLSELERKAKILPHQVLIEEKKVGLYTLVDRDEAALDAGQKALAQLGIRMPNGTVPTHMAIVRELLKAKWGMRSKSSEDLLSLPAMNDWKSQRAMDILPYLIHPAAVCRPDWIPVLSLKMFNLTRKKGLSNGSGFSTVAYAMLLAILGDYEKSYQYGTTAIELEENIDSPQLKCMTTTMFSALVVHWKQPIVEQFKFAERGMQYGRETGDVHYGGLCRCAHFYAQFFKGTSLPDLEKHMSTIAPFMDHVSGTPNFEMYALWLTFFLRLQGKTTVQCSFFPQQFDLESFEERLISKGNPQNQAQFELLQAMESVFAGEDVKALDHITKCAKHHDTFISLILQAEFFFYSGLIASRVLRSGKTDQQAKLKKMMSKSLKKLGKMDKHSPDNFSSRYHLLQAEQLRHEKKDLDALKMVQKALSEARESMSLHIASLCAAEAKVIAEQAGIQDLVETMKSIESQSLDWWGYSKN